VVKLDRQDGSLSLMGPFGGINNLDVLVTPENDPLEDLKVGEFVDFRLVQPVAVDVRKLPTPARGPSVFTPPLAADLLRSGTTLKAELLESFEITHLHATVTPFFQTSRCWKLKAPKGTTFL
jgi:hypothetical protein